MEKRIYLKAYISKNLGDDMFVRCVAERYPDVLFQISAASSFASAFQKQTNVRNLSSIGILIDRVSKKTVGKQICASYHERTADAMVHIGGSIFIEPPNFILPKRHFTNPNMFVIGCNFGPHKTETYREYIYKRLEKATDVCFRDRYSYEEFSLLNNVRFAPDVLFGYPNYPACQMGRGVGISVINLSKRAELKHIADDYYSILAQAVDRFVRMGMPVKLLSFCVAEGDTSAIAEITQRCETNAAEVYEYNGDIDVMLDAINACEYIIASRFHAMIIGWSLSKKVLPIIYSDKQLHVIGDVGFLGACWDLRESEIYTAEKLLKSIFSAPIHPVDEYRLASQRQFEALDRYLKADA